MAIESKTPAPAGAAAKAEPKVHNPFELKAEAEGGTGKVFRVDHGTLKHRPISADPLKPAKPVLIKEGELVLLDPVWVKSADPHGNRFVDPKKAWVHPNERRDPKAEDLVRENEELKKRLEAAEAKK